jgi:hypothetical protein
VVRAVIVVVPVAIVAAVVTAAVVTNTVVGSVALVIDEAMMLALFMVGRVIAAVLSLRGGGNRDGRDAREWQKQLCVTSLHGAFLSFRLEGHLMIRPCRS